MTQRPLSNDDVFLWPDGTWCLRGNCGEYLYMSDDFETLWEGTFAWIDFMEEHGE